MEGAYAFGVVRTNSGARRVTWIEKPVAVTPELLSMTGSVPPTQVMRFAGPCQEDACSHFDGRDCRLATRIVEMLDPVVTALPPCAISSELPVVSARGRPGMPSLSANRH